MAYVKINDDHLKSYADSIRYTKDGIEYTTTLERARAEIAEDNGYFEDISEAVQSKTGQVEPYEKDELEGAIDGIVTDPNANLDAYIQGNLTDIVFNGTVIATGTFRGTNITSISMPNVITIGAYALAQTYYLSSIVLPDSVSTLGAQVFYASDITSFVLSPNITNIPQSCFQDSKKFTTLVLPKKLTSISNSAFSNCTGLLTVDMSEVEGLAIVAANSFSNTTCTFLFRDQTQLDAYAAATNWSALASRFQIKGGGS